MTVLRTYKVLSGVFLLALYAFVATPVQYWHHHTIHAAIQKETQNSRHDQLLQNNGSQQDANCLVCSHKYSSYSEISIIAFEPCAHIAEDQLDPYLVSAVTPPSFLFFNKGPPAC
ncbi:MAG TPA: hypothetical protein VIM79_19910 [Niastella sp.]